MGKCRDSGVYLVVWLDTLLYVTGRPVKQENVDVGDRVMVPDGRKGIVTGRTSKFKRDYCTVNLDPSRQTAKGHHGNRQ